MKKVEMIVAGAVIMGVAGYVVAKTMKNFDIESKAESEKTDNFNIGDSKQEKLHEQESILEQVQEQAKSSVQTKSEEMKSRHLEADEMMKTSLDKIFNGEDSVSVQSENEQSFDEVSDDLVGLLK